MKNFIIPPIPPALIQPILDALEVGAPETQLAVALGVNYKTWQRLRHIKMSRVPAERQVRITRALDRVQALALVLDYPSNKERPQADE